MVGTRATVGGVESEWAVVWNTTRCGGHERVGSILKVEKSGGHESEGIDQSG